MPTQPPSDRFKADMPQIPGVSSLGTPSPPRDSSLKLGIGLLLVLVVVFLGARWALHPRHTEPRVADQPQIDAIVAQVREKNYGFRSLIHEIVQSQTFQQK